MLECTPSKRAAFLQKNAKDGIVGEEVLRLLEEHDKSNSFLSTPPFIDRRLDPGYYPERLKPGEVLAGRFRIVDFIAAGGMGSIQSRD